MRMALGLARGQFGRTGDNPAVGCVIVNAGHVVGRGATADGGRPHAEEIALEDAGDRALGACAYVTLEPCGGRSSGAPGCGVRLATAGVARVVYAVGDPHPLASGGGVRALQAAGVEVEAGVLAREAAPLYAGFIAGVAKKGDAEPD